MRAYKSDIYQLRRKFHSDYQSVTVAFDVEDIPLVTDKIIETLFSSPIAKAKANSAMPT